MIHRDNNEKSKNNKRMSSSLEANIVRLSGLRGNAKVLEKEF